MLLESGAWASRDPPSLEVIFDTIRGFRIDDAFVTDPDGLVRCLNALAPRGFTWTLIAREESAAATSVLARSMETCRSPAAALVSNGYHWTLVTDLATSDATIPVSVVTGKGFPEPAGVHTAAAVRRATEPAGRIEAVRIENPGDPASVEWVEYGTWRRDYFTPNRIGTHYRGLCVCIVLERTGSWTGPGSSRRRGLVGTPTSTDRSSGGHTLLV